MHVLGLFLLLGIVGAIIGYTTKWTSVQLVFHPAEFTGIGPIGWQGVVQRRSPKFAAGVADTLKTVVPIDELAGRVDPHELASLLTEAFGDRLQELAPTVIDQVAPGAWEAAPDHVKEMIRQLLQQETEAALAEIITEAQPVLGEILDIKAMIVDLLSGENADRLAKLVREISATELKTIIRYGAVVGFFVGLAEAVLYLVFDRWWLLPIVGACDGLVNNWMGIQMIFRPLEKKTYLGLFPYQGLFPKRQAQIAHDYGRLIASDVLTPAEVATRLQGTETKDALLVLARKVLERRLTPQLEMLGPALGVEVTTELRDKAIDAALGALVEEDVDLNEFPAVIVYLDERLQIAETIESRLVAMDKMEFERLLRGIFEDDEKLLIGIGGAIGAVIGCIQALLVLSLGLAPS